MEIFEHKSHIDDIVTCVARRATGFLSEEVEAYWKRFVEDHGTGYVDDSVTLTRAMMLMPKWKWLPVILKRLVGWGQRTNPYRRQRKQIERRERVKQRLEQQGHSLKRGIWDFLN